MTNAGKIGCAASFAVFALAIALIVVMNFTEPEWAGERWVAGKSYARDFKLEKSIGGCFEIVRVEGSFVGVDVPIVSTENKAWDSSPEWTVIKVKGIPVSTGRKNISANFRVAVPENAGLVGRQGKLIIRGVVKYPYINLAGAIGPNENKTYEVREVEFEKSITDIRIVANEKDEKDGAGWVEGLIGLMAIVSVIGGLISLGIREE